MKNFFKKYPLMILFIALFILFVGAFVGYELWYQGRNDDNQQQYDALREEAWITVSSDFCYEDYIGGSITREPTDLELFANECEYSHYYNPYLMSRPDFSKYIRLNDDIIAYLEVPGTNISYPVLRHKKISDYYLLHNIDGSSGHPGCLFVETYNSGDFTDAATIIYGHNMHNDTMFGTLDYYNKASFRESHPYFIIYRPSSISVYEVGITTSYSNEHILIDNFEQDDNGAWHYKGCKPDDQIMIYNKFKAYNASNLYINEESFNEDDKCVVLATCDSDHNQRFTVTGRLIFNYKY